MSNLSFEEAINRLSDDDVKVRKEAIESLVGTNDESAIEPLIKATTDDNAQVRLIDLYRNWMRQMLSKLQYHLIHQVYLNVQQDSMLQ